MWYPSCWDGIVTGITPSYRACCGPLEYLVSQQHPPPHGHCPSRKHTHPLTGNPKGIGSRASATELHCLIRSIAFLEQDIFFDRFQTAGRCHNRKEDVLYIWDDGMVIGRMSMERQGGGCHLRGWRWGWSVLGMACVGDVGWMDGL